MEFRIGRKFHIFWEFFTIQKKKPNSSASTGSTQVTAIRTPEYRKVGYLRSTEPAAPY